MAPTTFGEVSLNSVGYIVLRKDPEAAIETFRLKVQYFPDSSNVYDSLGEAYMLAGQKELAIRDHQRSLGLDPENSNAVKKLKELGGGR